MKFFLHITKVNLIIKKMDENLGLLITDKRDIVTAVKIISEELYVIGHPAIPDYDDKKNLDCLLVALINSVWTLIKQRKKYVYNKREIDQSKMLLEETNKSLLKKISELEINIKIAKSDANKKMNELELMKQNNDQVLQELNNSKKEFQKLQLLLQSRNEEYYNRIRQKECEIIELQKTLSQKIGVKRCSKKLSNDENEVIINNIDVSEEFQATDNQQLKQIEKLYEKSIYKMENTIQTLALENINLRNSIHLFTRKLCDLHQFITANANSTKQIITSTAESKDANKSSKHSLINYSGDLSEHLFYIPGDNLIKYVEQWVNGVIDDIINQFKLCNT
ncbi:uncharacterized protein LOC142323562 isoform X1 [Lycorma delicatula]|uniref:uncharacterized protein LOC142323562 isoform X1 n=1 Tax=Lycorma delicatula TaxID=130591 RepID=UPI003F51196B